MSPSQGHHLHAVVNYFRDNVHLYKARAAHPATINAPYWVFNIDNSQPTPLMDRIQALENDLGTQTQKHFLSMQFDDVTATSDRTQELDYWERVKPSMPVDAGVQYFVDWSRS